MIDEALAATIASLDVASIPESRRRVLAPLVHFVATHRDDARLTFICTHNSRRSHMAQLWAAAAAARYGATGVSTFSGGTEVTAFNPRAVSSLRRAGFRIDDPGGDNPRYRVSFSPVIDAMRCWSKRYDDDANPRRGFAAVMTCSEADAACPIVVGAAARISLPYDDPKAFDDGELETTKYDERCFQIGAEMLYVFSRIQNES